MPRALAQLDEFLPAPDVTERHGRLVHATPDRVDAAVRALTLREVPVVAALAAVVLAALWGVGPVRDCPAVGWSDQLTVELADGWPAASAVRVECASWCGLTVESVPGGPDTVTVPLTGATAVVLLTMATPESVAVTVLGPDDGVLGAADVDLDWRRVGGTAECGGPHEATATVPAR